VDFLVGTVEKYLLNKIEAEHSIHITLIDPEKVTIPQSSRISGKVEASGTSAIMIGGSTFISTSHLDNVVKSIKQKVKIPTILFPNNVTGISRYADAIWFMSLLNSVDPYFLIGAQVLGAPIIKKFGIEPIPLGYIVVGNGGAAGIVGRAIPVPYSKSELAVAHALAGQYLGMRFIYLEAGSGARKPVPAEMISMVKSNIDVPLIVGGGIKSKEQALAAASAGADIIVTGNIVENPAMEDMLSEIVISIQSIRTRSI
jgi:phosphoglycerol geranylgeranyltransferase